MMTAATAMRAAVIEAPGISAVTQVPRPEPAAHEVRVRITGSGVCGSNLPVWEGRDWFQYPNQPGAPGHEGWGVVDAVGYAVSRIVPGDRVAVISHHAFAEFDIAAEDAVLPLPAAIAGRPLPAEPLGCAMNIFRRSNIDADHDVAIIGVGFMGALLVRLCAQAGARVLAISRRPFALDVARQQGAAETIEMDDHGRIVERVKRLTGGAGCARVIEAVGMQWPLDLAGELAAERGRLIIAGFHQDGPRRVNMQLWNWRGLDVVNAHERDPAAYMSGMRDALAKIESGVLDPWQLCTHRFDLDDLGAALEAVRTRPDGFMKALVTA